MGHVGGAKGASGDSKTDPVELVTFEQRRFHRVDRIFSVGWIILQPQSLGWQPPERTTAGQNIFPELSRRSSVRISTGHAYDGDRWCHDPGSRTLHLARHTRKGRCPCIGHFGHRWGRPLANTILSYLSLSLIAIGFTPSIAGNFAIFCGYLGLNSLPPVLIRRFLTLGG